MARIQRTEAIVLKAHNFRETSRIVTLFSKDFGKLRLLAKGVRKPGSRFGASLELFTHSSVIFYQKETREVHTISDSQILHSFDILRSHLGSFILASNVLHFLLTVTPSEESHPQMFLLSLIALRLIEEEPKVTLLWGYLVKGLALLGYSPELFSCTECKKRSMSTLFSIDRGGIVCPQCRGNGIVLSLSRGTIEFLKNAQECEMRRIRELEISSAEGGELEKFFSQFIRYHLNVEFSFRLPSASWLLR